MDGFERRKEQKKESIRRAALALFQSFGFNKVSISDIAERAGVSQVTIYNHFSNKEALIRDVLQWFSRGLLEKYQSIMQSDAPFLERLENIVFDKSEVVSQFQGELLQTWMQNDPEMQDYLEDLLAKQVMPLTRAFLEEGLKQGYIDQRFSLNAIMTYFEIIRRGFFAVPNIQEQAKSNPALIKELIELMTYGLNG
jgi:AcrR family transcriptional regulator